MGGRDDDDDDDGIWKEHEVREGIRGRGRRRGEREEMMEDEGKIKGLGREWGRR